jgi:glycosyltransferase involved in cell wall biosynthesis
MIRIGYFFGTSEDWGGASRALLNFVKSIDKEAITPIVILTKEGKLSAELRDLGFECTFWPKHELSKNILSNAYHIVQSARFLREMALDIVHLNYGSTEWKSPIVLAAKWRKIPIVYHYHSEIKAPSRFVRYASAVIVVSDYIKRHAETLGRPTYTVHNIVDIRRFAAGKDIGDDLGIPPDFVIVSFVGQVKIIKGIKTFLRAIDRIERPNVRFLIAGEFREKSAEFTREMFDEAVSKDKRIMYLGYRTDVQDLYQTSDVIVMPSLYDEPCAMVLFEAAAANKPIVATATGGTPEVVQDNVTGMLFDRDDDSALAVGIEKLLVDATLRKEMGERAYTRAVEEFSERPVEKLESLYRELVSAR